MDNTHITPHPDPEVREFEEALLLSVDQMKRGEFGRVHTATDIAQYKARGRPLGSTKPNAKQAVKIRLDPDVLSALRATGRGWQTRINALLRMHISGNMGQLAVA